MAANDIADLLLRIDATTEGLRRELKRADKLVDDSTGNINRSTSKIDKSFNSLGASAKRLGVLLGGAFGTRELARYADAWTNINNRLRLVTATADEFSAAQNGITLVARQTRQPLEATAELYQRIAMNQSQLGLSGQEVVDITRTISQAMVVSGTSAQGAQAALVQLGQAFASGTLRGEELNSVLEQAPGLAQAIATGMGVTIGQLRALGAEGQLTADAVVRALQDQADAVQGRFDTMAPTIDQAMTTVGNSILVLIGRMDEASGASSTLADGIIRLSDAIGGMGAVSSALVTVAAEFTDLGDLIGYYMARSSLAIDAFIAKSTFQSKKYAELTRQMALMDQSRLEQRAAMEARLAAVLDDSVSAQEDASGAAKAAQPVYKDLSELYEEMDKELKSINDAHKKFTDRLRDIQEAVNPTTRAARLFNEEVEFMQLALEKNYISGEQFNDWLYKAKTELLPDVKVGAEGVKNEIEEITAKADPMTKIYERGLERMRDGFGDFFQELIVDGRASFSGLLDLFKRMIAEMIATAAANRVMVSLGIGGGASSAMASGGGGGGGGLASIANMGRSLWGGFSGGTSSIMSNVASFGQYLPQAWQAGYAQGVGTYTQGLYNTGQQFGGGIGTGALVNAGAGMAGGYVGSQVFGSGNRQANSAWGQTAGSLIGSIWGPIGSAIGGFIGSGVDVLFGSGKPSDKRQYASGGFSATDQILSGFDGKKFRQENQDAAAALLAQIQQMGMAIGGTSAAGSVSVGGRTGLRLSTGQGESSFRTFKTEADLLSAAWKEVLAGATALEPSIKRLSEAFDGNLESSVAYTQSLQALWEASGRSGATAAATDYANAQRTLSQIYSASTSSVRQLAADYDGSAQATAVLSQALVENQGVAYQLAMQYQQVRESVSGLFGSLSESIRTSLMSQEELYNYQRTQVDTLSAALATMTDPAQIMETSQRIEQLVSGMWGRLSEEQRQEMGAGFLDTISDVERVATQQLDKQLKMVEQSQERTGEIVRQSIRDAAAELAASAQTYQLSAQTIQQAAQMMLQAAQAQMRGREVNA